MSAQSPACSMVGVQKGARLQETLMSGQGLASMVGSWEVGRPGTGMSLPGVDGLLYLACP